MLCAPFETIFHGRYIKDDNLEDTNTTYWLRLELSHLLTYMICDLLLRNPDKSREICKISGLLI